MNSIILKQLFEAYNKTEDWEIIINNSDQLNNLLLENKNENIIYKLLLNSDKFWEIIDSKNNILYNNGNSILEIVNNLTEKNNDNLNVELIGICIKNIGDRRKPIYIPVVNKLITLDEWKEETLYHWWIPIYLHFGHFKRAKSILEQNIASLSGKFEFNPEQVIDILSKLLMKTNDNNILFEFTKIINYYLNEYPYLSCNIRHNIKQFEINPSNRKEINDIVQFLVKSIIICDCSRSFLIKFWTEYLARQFKWLYKKLGNRVFKMFYKHWNIDLDIINKYLLPKIISIDKLIKFLNNKEFKEYDNIKYLLNNYPYKINYDIESEEDRIKQYIRYICIISFKQGYIPFNADHFNNGNFRKN